MQPDGRVYRCENGHAADGAKAVCEFVLDNCIDVGCSGGNRTPEGQWVPHEPHGHMGRYCGRPVHPTSCEHPLEGYERHRTILGLVGPPGTSREAHFFTIDRCPVCHAEKGRRANAEETDALLRQSTGHSLEDLTADMERLTDEMREGTA